MGWLKIQNLAEMQEKKKKKEKGWLETIAKHNNNNNNDALIVSSRGKGEVEVEGLGIGKFARSKKELQVCTKLIQRFSFSLALLNSTFFLS